MGMVSELIVSVGVEGTGAVISALKEIDGAQVQLRDSTKNLSGTTQSETQNMGMSWSDMVTGVNQSLGIARTVISGVKQAIEFSEEGANLQTLEQRFERLATSVGTTKDSLLADMQTATKGVKSDSELMGLAVDMIGLGFAGTEDDAVRLASVAGALDMNMNQLALTLANETTMRFDQLGVGIDGFDEKLQKLKDTGMSTSDAFKEAFLQQAERQIEKVGHIADTAAGKWERMNAAQGNFMDNMKTMASDNSGWWTSMWTTVFDSQNQATEMENNLRKAAGIGLITQQELAGQLQGFRQSGSTKGIEQTLANILPGFSPQEYTQALSEMETKLYEIDNMRFGTKLADNAIASAEAVAQAAQEMEQMQQVALELTSATGLTAWFGNIVDFAKQYTTALEGITEQEQIMADTKGIDPEKFKAAEQAIADLKQGMTDLANQMTLDMFHATIAIGGVTDAEMGAYLDMAVQMGFISEEGADAAVDAYNAAIEKINEFAIDEKTGNVVVDAAAAFATFDLIEAYAFADKTVRVMMKMGGDTGMGSAGPWDQAIGGPVYPGNVYNWQEPGREGEILLPSQYGRVMSSTEVAQMLREVTRPGDGVAAGQQAQVVNNNHTEVTVQATIASDYDVDKLTREIVRRINA